MSIKQYFKRGLNYILTGVPNNIVYPQIVNINSSNLLEGRNALITGGTSGIGKSIAIAFLKAGASVVITGRNRSKVDAVINEIKKINSDYNIFGLDLDNTDINSFHEKLEEIESMLSKTQIDILVNNAGINGGILNSCSEEEYDIVMNTNLKGMIFLTRVVSKRMIQKKIQGNILNIASSSSLRPATTAYTLSKWGIRGLTVGWAKKLIQHGIVVNGIAPGPTATPMLIKEGTDSIYLPNNPSHRYVMPEEIANFAVILSSGLGRMVIGDILYITGGAGTITVDDINY